MTIKLITMLFISLSCNQQEYDLASCNELSMKKFKGVPTSGKKFEQNCKNFKITYTAEMCQSALAYLIQTNSLTEVKKEFGDPIEHCFSGADLKRFNKN